MPKSTKNKRNETEKQIGRSYMREFAPAMIAYVVSLPAVIIVDKSAEVGVWRYVLLLLPVGAIVLVVRAVARHLGRLDEYQRNLQLAAMSVGFGAAMLTAATIGLFSTAGLSTDLWGPWAIFGVGMTAWGIAATKTVRC